MTRGRLFSEFGPPLAAAAAELLDGVEHPRIAYIPAASTASIFEEANRELFAPVAPLDIAGVSSGWQPDPTDAEIIEGASLLYITGGNTYVLADRLHQSGLFELIREQVLAGVPLLTFSAGTVMCGPTILSTNDWNIVGSTVFTGLGVLPLHANVHYPVHDPSLHDTRDGRIWEFVEMRGEPVIALEDRASLSLEGERTMVAGGRCWLFTPDGERRRLDAGDEVRATSTPSS